MSWSDFPYQNIAFYIHFQIVNCHDYRISSAGMSVWGVD
jgi:hypothetical protein